MKFCTRNFHKILCDVCEFHIIHINLALLTDNEFIFLLSTFIFLAVLNSFRICELRDNKSRESRNFLAKISEIILKRIPGNNVIFREYRTPWQSLYIPSHNMPHADCFSFYSYHRQTQFILYYWNIFNKKNAKLVLFIWKASCYST